MAPPVALNEAVGDECSSTPLQTNVMTVKTPSKSIRDRSNSLPAEEVTLEDRVIDLELKLATLSRLLQQRQREQGSPLLHPRSVSPPLVSLLTTAVDTASTPYLESPCPSRRASSNRLSAHHPPENNGFLQEEEQRESQEEPHTMISIGKRYVPSPRANETGNVNHSRPPPPPSPIAMEPLLPYESPRPDKTTPPIVRSKQPEPEVPPPPPLVSAATASKTPKKGVSPPELEHQDSTERKKSIQLKWMDYLNTFQESTPDVDVQMEEFIRVPSQVESLFGFGFFICVDSFLYILTILPLRFLWSGVLLVVWTYGRITHSTEPATNPYRFHRRHMYQLIQVSIIYTVYKVMLAPISIGKLYHWIRGQAMLKLYVLVAIVEVFDRLMCSLGQDCLDSMYWNTTRRPRSSRMVISILVVLCYTSLHSLILFVHVATLNVAMNSADQALMTLLLSGNFAEIKSTVFKKYNKPNLFKITSSDICERFKLSLFLSLVFILNVCQGMDRAHIYEYIQMCGIVWCTEVFADWIKHSFITKFNFIPSSVYPEYALLLAGDVTGIGHEGVNLDNTHAVVKRIGLAQMPLVCVMIRYLAEAGRYARLHFQDNPLWEVAALGLATWGLVLLIKIALGFYLQSLSRDKLYMAPELKKPSPAKKKRD